jgi:hypothetical protein
MRDHDKNPRPGWRKRPFEQFLEFAKQVTDVVHLSMHGIATLRGAPQLVRALVRLDAVSGSAPSRTKNHKAQVKKAEAEAALARREVEQDFPLLHGQAVVALWSALESLARNIVTTWLTNAPETISNERVRRLRVPFFEYEDLPKRERIPYIVELLEREVEAPLKLGVGRFEELLDIVGLAGSVEERVRHDLFEMGQVRNAIVHRGGVADRRLVEACPWLSLKPGDHVHVSHEQFAKYVQAMQGYVLECIQRALVQAGVPRDQAEKEDQGLDRHERVRTPVGTAAKSRHNRRRRTGTLARKRQAPPSSPAPSAPGPADPRSRPGAA